MGKKKSISKIVRTPQIELKGIALDQAIKEAQKDKQWVREVKEFIKITS